MTYTRKARIALSIGFAALAMTFGLLLGNQDADAVPPGAQFATGETYQVQIPDAEWTAAQARGPIQPWPGRSFTAEYLGEKCNEVGCYPAWLLSNGVYGHVPEHWVQD